MRAVIHCLALAPLLYLAGCGTLSSSSPSPDRAGDRFSISGADPAEALAHYSQALISEVTLGEARNSFAHLAKAAEADPANLPLALKVAVDCVSRKDYAGAILVLNRAAPFHRDSVEIQLLLGTACQGLGNLDDARAAYLAAIRLAPGRHESYIRLGVLYEMRSASRKTLALIDDGLARVKDPAPILGFCSDIAQIHLAAGDARGAIPFVDRIRHLKPESNSARELLGRCYAGAGRMTDAIREFTALVEREPENSRFAFLLGELYEQDDQADRAEAAYKRAIKGTSPDPQAWFRLASLQVDRDPELAIATLKEARTTCPLDLRSRVFLALLYVRLDRAEEALAEFAAVEKAIGEDQNAARMIQPGFYFWYGEACDKAGRHEEAERILKKYLASRPDSPEALNALAYLWAERGVNLDQALEYIAKALKQEPGNGAFLDTKGWLHFRKGDLQAALRELKQAAQAEGEDPTILEHVGDVLAAMNQADKAIGMWMKSLKRDPGEKRVRDKLIKAGVREKTLPPPVPGPGRVAPLK